MPRTKVAVYFKRVFDGEERNIIVRTRIHKDQITSVPRRLGLHSRRRRQRTTVPHHFRPVREADHCRSSCACASFPSLCQRSNPPIHSTASNASRQLRLGTRTKIARRCDHHGKQRVPCAGGSCALASTWQSKTRQCSRSQRRKRFDYAKCMSEYIPARLGEDLFCTVSIR